MESKVASFTEVGGDPGGVPPFTDEGRAVDAELLVLDDALPLDDLVVEDLFEGVLF